MRHKCFLLLLPFLSLSFLGCGSADNPLSKPFMTDFEIMGPFTEGCDDYILSSQVKVLANINSVREKLTVKTIDGLMVKTQVKNLHQIVKGEIYTLTFILPFKSSLTDRGLSIAIDFMDSGSTALQTIAFNIRPIKPTTINPKQYIDDYFVNEDIVVDPDNYSQFKDEKIRFDRTYDYFNVDSYYKLDLNDALITYECTLPCPTCIAHLHFTDFLRIFPYLDSDDAVPNVEIPLRVIQKKTGVCFAFPSNMYVKPQTLEMSLIAKPGFTETSHFYLPKNRCEELMDQVFTIVAEEFGYAKTSFSWDMRYTNANRLIGDCSNSDYCVIGEMNNG